jgi:hypothetical protein
MFPILFGTKGKTTDVARGQFFCPHCRGVRPYLRKKVTNYFTLYFIPLFPTHELSEFVTCQVCQASFPTDVLKPSAESRALEVVETVRAQLKSGLAVQTIVAGLLQAGSSREDAAVAIYAAAEGNLTACNHCHLLYAGHLAYCSACGARLEPFERRPD